MFARTIISVGALAAFDVNFGVDAVKPFFARRGIGAGVLRGDGNASGVDSSGQPQVSYVPSASGPWPQLTQFFPKRSKSAKTLALRSKLKTPKTAHLASCLDPKTSFGGENRPKGQKSSKVSVSQNHRGGLCH